MTGKATELSGVFSGDGKMAKGKDDKMEDSKKAQQLHVWTSGCCKTVQRVVIKHTQVL